MRRSVAVLVASAWASGCGGLLRRGPPDRQIRCRVSAVTASGACVDTRSHPWNPPSAAESPLPADVN